MPEEKSVPEYSYIPDIYDYYTWSSLRYFPGISTVYPIYYIGMSAGFSNKYNTFNEVNENDKNHENNGKCK